MKYTVVERKFTIQFTFMNKQDAVEFTIPDEYKDKFELTDSIEQVRFTYVRVAQIKTLRR